MNGLQFNLLPDVKLDYIKTRAMRRLILLISTIVSGVSIALFLILFLYVRVNQPQYMKALDKDIANGVKDIKSTPDLDKILTIQNQLSSLPDLHSQKVVGSRSIGYLKQLVPNQASLESAEIDYAQNTITMTGRADTLEIVNKFADALKFTDYKVNDGSNKTGKAFSNVVLKSFGVGTKSGDAATRVDFTIAANFDTVIFSNIAANSQAVTAPNDFVTLTVPSIITTRSETEKPTAQFTNKTPDTQGQGQ